MPTLVAERDIPRGMVGGVRVARNRRARATGARQQSHARSRARPTDAGAGASHGAHGRDAISAGRCYVRHRAAAYRSRDVRVSGRAQPGAVQRFQRRARNVSYNFDLFGGYRRELEALAAEVDYQAYELEAARLTLASNVVTAAIRQASLRAQVETLVALLAAQREQLGIIEERYRSGGVAWLDVQNQRARVAETEAGLPLLRAQEAQAGHLLAVLTGVPPAAAQTPAVRLAELTLPAELPVRLPSELVRRRPDIRASEALLHRASANVGVATADLYPKLVISGGFSSSQLNIGDLLGNGINIWNIGANLLQPVFRGGELQAKKRAAEAAFDQAAASYRISVLQGLQNVADVLRALEGDTRAFAARSEQAARANEAYQIALGRYSAGGVSQLAVLDADRQRLQAELDRVEARANRYADAAALFQALGGGWKSESNASAR